MGSATLFHLARRGLRVLGIERFDLVHEYGSSHGLTRIIRLAYWEHPTYVTLLWRAYELWRELETLAGERLLHITGSVDAGPESGAIFEGALKSSRLHGLAHEVMNGDELHRRFPGYRLPKRDPLPVSARRWIPAPRAMRHRARRAGACSRRGGPLPRAGDRMGCGERPCVGAHGARTLRGRAPGHLRRAVGLEARSRAERARRPGAAGARVASARPARATSGSAHSPSSTWRWRRAGTTGSRAFSSPASSSASTIIGGSRLIPTP